MFSLFSKSYILVNRYNGYYVVLGKEFKFLSLDEFRNRIGFVYLDFISYKLKVMLLPASFFEAMPELKNQ